MRLLLVALVAVTCNHALAEGFGVDAETRVTVKLEDLGSFLAPYYKDPKERFVTDDIEFLGNRLYISHGYTNTKAPQQLIYFDLEKNAYGRHENTDGSPMTWRIEKTFKTHLFGGELFILDYDPLSGPAKLLRVKPDFSVVTQAVSNDAHNRDVTVFDGKIFVSHGRTDVPWPSMRWSHDDGKTWQQIEQGGVSEQSLYECFFTFKGKLYAGTHSKTWKEGFHPNRKSDLTELAANMVVKRKVPWLIRYTGRDDAPWEPVVMCTGVEKILPGRPDDDQSRLSSAIYKALDTGDELLALINQQGYRFLSIDPLSIESLPLGQNVAVMDFYKDKAGRNWILASEKTLNAETGRGMVIEYLGSGKVRLAAVFASKTPPHCLAVRDKVAYLGYWGGHLARVPFP